MTIQTKMKAATPNVVNGINVDDVFALIDGVKRDAAKAKTSWRVTTAWQGQTRSRTQVDGFSIGGERVERRFSIDVDEPCELGGSNRFANPQEYLLASLNACMTVGYAAQCAVRGIVLESLEIETDGDIDLRGFLGLDPYEGYLDDCASVVFAAPTYTRRKMAWPSAIVADVERRARSFPHLDGYRFEVSDDRFGAAEASL